MNRFLETNIENVYAIGDCAEQHEAIGQRRNIEAVWYTGRMMGETVAQTICGNKTAYKPGHWFNSAKFLDIEYQTYGWVFSERNKTENEGYFQWKHPKEAKMRYHFIRQKKTIFSWELTPLGFGCVIRFLTNGCQKKNQLNLFWNISQTPILILNFTNCMKQLLWQNSTQNLTPISL